MVCKQSLRVSAHVYLRITEENYGQTVSQSSLKLGEIKSGF